MDRSSRAARSAACVSGLLLACVLILNPRVEAQQMPVEFNAQALFRAGEAGYTTFRIPSLAVTRDGTVLAFAAGRRGGHGDWVDIDTVMRRSTDGGDTFEPMRVITDDGRNVVDNATVVIDPSDDRVLLMYQINYARAYLKVSSDQGESWSAPREITEAFETFRTRDGYDWRVVGMGPSNGVALPSGRLVFPVWLSTQKAHRPSIAATIYSDDRGETWQAGEVIARHSEETPNPSEMALAVRGDGGVLAAIRNESTRYRKLVSTSADGASGWSPPRFHPELFDPICLASLATTASDAIVFAHPDSSARDATPVLRWGARRRENLTIRLSLDGGETWPHARVLAPGRGGYTALATGPDGTIYCLAEQGALRDDPGAFAPDRVILARFNTAWITGGASQP